MALDDYTEHFPLAPIDDHMIHQTADPIRVVWTSDPQVYERYWMVAHDLDGRVVIAVGGSFYPNLDCAEAYAIVNVDGRHTAVRGFRRLGADRMDLHIGPIQPTVVEGMRRWRFVLADNEWDVAFDFSFHDTTRAVLRDPIYSQARDLPGRAPHVTAGFETFGEVEGWVRSGDTTLALDRLRVKGTRDRHWGTGRGVGGPALQLAPAPLQAGRSGNSFVNFAKYGIWGDRVFYPIGDPRPGAGRVVRVDRRARFEPDTNIFTEAVVDYELADGAHKQLHFERMGHQTAYLRCGMYGGTPDGLRYQGLYPGEDLVEGESHDVTRPEARSYLAGLDEHQCRVTCEGETVVGVFQPIDPDAYYACLQGKRGWSFL